MEGCTHISPNATVEGSHCRYTMSDFQDLKERVLDCVCRTATQAGQAYHDMNFKSCDQRTRHK